MKIEVLKNNPIRLIDESQVIYKEANQKVEIKHVAKNTGDIFEELTKSIITLSEMAKFILLAIKQSQERTELTHLRGAFQDLKNL